MELAPTIYECLLHPLKALDLPITQTPWPSEHPSIHPKTYDNPEMNSNYPTKT